MTSPQRATEAQLVTAHRHGRQRAAEAFAAAIDSAMGLYPGKHEAQFAFIAGFAAEIRRIAARTQNKGFRTDVNID